MRLKMTTAQRALAQEKERTMASPACTAEDQESQHRNSTMTTEPLAPDQIRGRLRPVEEHQSEGI